MRSLRTRLVVTIGVVLAASIALSGLLSRRATLVEVRKVVSRPPQGAAFDPVATAVVQAVAKGGTSALQEALESQARVLGRPLVVVSPDGTSIVASSAPVFRESRVRRDPDRPGDIELDFSVAGGINTVAVRGAQVQPLVDAGKPVGDLIALPEDAGDADSRAEERGARAVWLVPSWMVATASVAGAGLLLMVALSRHILGPVNELTDAVRRMEAGDLGARAERAAQGGDEIARLAASFNAMADRVAEHDQARRQMVADVAHELRSPVTNLRCVLEAVQDGLSQPDAATIDALHDEVMFLQHVIADLQDLTLAEAGQLPLHLEPVRVQDVVNRAVASTANVRGPDVVIDLPPDLPAVTADPARLEQVLRNLLSNARRHAPESTPILVRAAATGGRVRIEVSDSGAGIAPEHLPHVFERFYRADRSRSRSTGGAGLGLAIVRQLIEAQGGSVGARSGGPGTGATFNVELPEARAAAPETHRRTDLP